jgi:hypothetical protein
MRRLASLRRSIAPSNGMDAKRSAEGPLSSPNAAQRGAESAGLDGGTAAAAQSAMLAIAAHSCNVSTGRRCLDGASTPCRVVVMTSAVERAGGQIPGRPRKRVSLRSGVRRHFRPERRRCELCLAGFVRSRPALQGQIWSDYPTSL